MLGVFVIGVVVGVVVTFIAICLTSISKKLDYEDKLWELERLKMEYENRK